MRLVCKTLWIAALLTGTASFGIVGCSGKAGQQNHDTTGNDAGGATNGVNLDAGTSDGSIDADPRDTSGGHDAPMPDTGTDQGFETFDVGPGSVCEQGLCESDADCDDGEFCNGPEVCDPASLGADEFGCVDEESACGSFCDEENDTCACSDDTDCDDGMFCNGEETCDAGDPDADPSGCVAGSRPNCSGTGAYCSDSEGRCCSDADPCPCRDDFDCQDGQWCNGVETCDPADPDADSVGCVDGPLNNICLVVPCDETNDCCETNMGCIDEGIDRCEDPDEDGDGHDRPACGGDDCDDSEGNRFPGNAESCDDSDYDCDPTTLGGDDQDGDGFVSDTCCNPQGDGTIECGRDCDDTDPTSNPDEAEICNGKDDDCDGLVDEGVDMALYRDRDGDGFGQPLCARRGCAEEDGWVNQTGDCDDSNVSIRPGDSSCIDSNTIRTCKSDGTWESRDCPDGTRCMPNVDGTGNCR